MFAEAFHVEAGHILLSMFPMPIFSIGVMLQKN